MKKKLRIIIDVEFRRKDSLDFNIRQKGKDTVDQQGLITILDEIRNKLTESEIMDEDDEEDGGDGDE
jgi:hypothetical protein